MKCPFCHHLDSKVTDSRSPPDLSSIRRRRECLACARRFTTFETVDLPIQVRKRDGSYQDFHIEKLTFGISASCHNTKISHEQVLSIASDIVAQLVERQSKVVDSVAIGAMVMERLKKLDRVAYIRFACVYRRFKDMDELMEAIETLSREDREVAIDA